ncbi:MAG TPA: thioesterase family protein [Gammaproteobacteria bacterium]|nr:thioesterase family protein [Gammaproteobacteria bacterium]
MTKSDSSAEPRKFAGRFPIKVRWSDLDALGHVNNSRFFTFFEQARVEWLEQTGWGGKAVAGNPVVVTASCHFKKAIGYPETVEVGLYAGPLGNSSIPTFYEIRTAAGELAATGDAVMVWIDARSGRSMPLPEAVRDLLKELPDA